MLQNFNFKTKIETKPRKGMKQSYKIKRHQKLMTQQTNLTAEKKDKGSLFIFARCQTNHR